MFKLYGKYTARYTPRDGEPYILKREARQYVGKTLTLKYIGPFGPDDSRVKFRGEHEFQIIWEAEEHLPCWYSHRDLSDIRELE